MVQQFNIWEGVFASYAEAAANARGDGFADDSFIASARNAVEQSLDAVRKSKPIPHFLKQRFSLLPSTVAFVLDGLSPRRQVSILDFGGAFGVGYLACQESMPQGAERLAYTIVDLPEVIEPAQAWATANGINISYLPELSSAQDVDLIFCSSAIQYIEDWQGLICDFAGLQPTHILMSDVFCGPFQSFASLQTYYDQTIPHWFFNEEQLLDVFASNSFELLTKTISLGRRAGVDDVLPMENFPDEHRLDYASTLLFKNTARSRK